MATHGSDGLRGLNRNEQARKLHTRRSMEGPSLRVALTVVLAALLASSQAFGQADWYVDAVGGNDGNSGTSWGTAFATIQKAVDSAVLYGGLDIWVAEGTYVLSSAISIPWIATKPQLRIFGGLPYGATSLDQQDWVAYSTVVDGNNAVASCFDIGWIDLIDGFTITRCRPPSGLPSGGGINIHGCGSEAPQPVLRNLVVRDNGGDTTHPPAYYEGGGIYIADCSPWIANVSFSNNRVWGHGGAVFARDTDGTPVDTYPTIVNSTFTGNHADVNGGAVGVYGGTLTIANSILWGDTAGDGVTHEVFGGTLVIGSSDIGQSGFAGVYGNINQDPQMTGVGRFHLRDGSPCIDAGNDALVPSFLTTDFDGDDRFVDGSTGLPGGTVDMGADEYVPGAFSGVIYVDGTDGNDSDSGTSWESAFATIQRAVIEAVADAEIWVRQGTYALTSSIVLTPGNSNLAFYGGFAGTETLRSERSGDASLTVIDGQDAHSCFSLAGVGPSQVVSNVIIDGFTLTRGNHAVTIVYSDGTVINNCRLTNSTVDGAINTTGSDLTVNGCFFSGNRATEDAGAIHIGGASDKLTVADSVFVGNAAEGLTFSTSGCGGAIRAGTGTIERSLFVGNLADRHGGAIHSYFDYGEGLVIRNCAFSGNHAGLEYFAGSGGAISGRVEVVNSSIAGNTSVSGGGGVNGTTSSTITNSILWGNADRNVNFACASGNVLYSDVGDSTYSDAATCQTPYGNINGDPAFVDADGGDNTVGTIDDNLSLQPGSPAIDSGDSTALPFGSLDLAWNPRHIDDPGVADSGYGPEPAIDMGAYERQASSPSATYDLTMVVIGGGSTTPSIGVHSYDEGSVITVSATANTGWQFTGWSGWVADPAAATTTVTMTWDRTVTANFKKVETLTVDVQGDGTGTVTSLPAGISCPGDCEEIFDHGTAVTLSAVVDAGTVFDGWAGDGCSGIEDCDVTMDNNVDVVALCNLEGACGIGDNMTLANITLDQTQTFEACTSITVSGDFRVEAPAEVVFRAAESVALGDGFVVESGASFRVEITGDVALREIAVSKTADPTTAYEGDPVTYTISVENTGNAALTEVTLTDDKCTAAPVFQSGDDGDSVLESGEIWVYECSGPAEADDFVNTATATFEDIFGQEVSDSGQASVTVEVAGCTGGAPSSPRYVDRSNGTIYDCWTGLHWLKDASCADIPGGDGIGRGNWSAALAAAAALAHGTCGLTDGSSAGDWRLPTMSELCGAWSGDFGWSLGFCDETQGLINDNFTPLVSNTAGDGGWSEGDPFTGLFAAGWYYWSSDEYDPDYAWVTQFSAVDVTIMSKTDTAVFIWPVR